MGVGRRRLTIVDRHELFAGTLQHALSTLTFDGRRVVTLDMSTREVVRAVARSGPDIVLVSLDLGRADTGEVMASLRDADLRVVALTHDDDPRRRGEALAAGVDATAARSWTLARLIDLLDATLRDQETVPPPLREQLVRAYHDGVSPHRARLTRLSPQEKDLLSHLMEGRTVAEVARLRVVAESTVRTQARSMMTKLAVSSQLTAVAVARQAGCSPAALRSHLR